MCHKTPVGFSLKTAEVHKKDGGLKDMDQKNRGYLEIFGELQSPASAGLKGFPSENSSRQIKQNLDKENPLVI